MFKYLLTGICCLFLFDCFSQEEVAISLPDTIIPASPDSNTITTELDAVVRDNLKIILSWKALNNQNDFFSVERSSNGKEFETIAVLKQTTGLLKMNWVDEEPARGKNHYRIRYSAANGTVIYSGIVTAQLGGNLSFRFYPNPADNVLIVRSEQAIDISIIDAFGKVRMTQTQLSGLQLLNISSLEKGAYILHIFNRQTNTHIQEKLVKN